MHAANAIYSASMRHGFKPDDRFFHVIGVVAVGINVVFVDCFVHLAPLHYIELVIRFLVSLAACHHVGCHWKLIVPMLFPIVTIEDHL